MRMRLLTRIVAFFAASLVLTATFAADAFCRTRTCTGANCGKDAKGCATKGEPLFWRSSCVAFFHNPSGISDIPNEDTIAAIVESSFATWSDIRCKDGPISLGLSSRGRSKCASNAYEKGGPNANIVFFKENDWTYKGIDGTLATTTVSFDSSTGEIFDADIAVNTANNSFSENDTPLRDEYNLELVLTHEVGHFIGIAHSEDTSAMMSPTTNPGGKYRKLTTDDVNAACALYPASRGATCALEPEGGFAPDCVAQGDASGCALSRLRKREGDWMPISCACAVLIGALRRLRRAEA